MTLREVQLRNLGIKSVQEINDWYKKALSNSYRIDDLVEAAEYLLATVDRGSTIYIIGDYDVDGITGSSILKLAAEQLGYKVVVLISDRVKEGYGANMRIVGEIPDGAFVLMVDNGIACLDVVKALKDKGCNVVILDHHEAYVNPETGKEELPVADFVIDPKAKKGSADFDGYCGAGLAFRYAGELYRMSYDEDTAKKHHAKLMGLAAMGTVCDVMELREENYYIVKNGMKYLQNPNFNTYGTFALISALEMDKLMNSKAIGFSIGPTINAWSRMGKNAVNVVDQLTYKGDWAIACRGAEKLVENNKARKEERDSLFFAAEDAMTADCLFGDVPLVLYVPNEKEGLIGILAGNFAEKYSVPVIALTDADEEGVIKGSGRSAGTYNIKENLDKCATLLLHYGGHAGAAGLSLKKENLEAFREQLQLEYARSIALSIENISAVGEDVAERIRFSADLGEILANTKVSVNLFEFPTNEVVEYDLEVKASDVPNLIAELNAFEPYGEGNPAPVFKITDFDVNPGREGFVTYQGKRKQHAKVFGKKLNAFGLDMAEQFRKASNPQHLTLVGTIGENYFNGGTSIQADLLDFEVVNARSVHENGLKADLAKKTAFAGRLASMAEAKMAMSIADGEIAYSFKIS